MRTEAALAVLPRAGAADELRLPSGGREGLERAVGARLQARLQPAAWDVERGPWRRWAAWVVGLHAQHAGFGK